MNKILLALLVLAISVPSLSAKRPSFPPKEDPHQREEWLRSTYISPENEKNIPANIDELQRNFAKSLPTASEGYYAKGSTIQSQTWLNAGPNNIGGRTRAVAFDVNNPNILIAGGVSGGIWRSVDGGNSWVQTTGKKEIPSVTTIVQDKRPGKNNIWYFAGGEVLGNSAGQSKGTTFLGNGISKSTDNGLTWKPLESTIIGSEAGVFGRIYRLVLDQTNQDKDIIYAACYGAILRSEDGGDTWETVLGNSANINRGPRYTDLVINDSGTLYVSLSSNSDSNQSGFFRSTNGKDWENITPDELTGNYTRTVIAAAPGDMDLVYFLTMHYGSGGVYCPEESSGCHTLLAMEYNDGAEWYDLSENLPYMKIKYITGVYNSQSGYDMCIAIKPDNPDVVIIGGTNIYVSDYAFFDSDNTQWVAGYNPNYNPYVYSDPSVKWLDIISEWRNMMFPTGGWDFHTIVFHPTNPNIVLTGSDHGIHRLNNLEESIDNEEFTWDDLNNGYNTTQFYDCSIHPTEAGNETIVGGMQDNGTWATFTSSVMFDEMTGGDGMHSTINENGDILVSSQSGNIMRLIYEDDEMVDGYNFAPQSDLGVSFAFYNPFEINPNDTKAIAMGAATGYVYCSDYTNESAASYNWYFRDLGYVNVTNVAFSTTPENVLYLGTYYDGLYRIEDVTNSNSSTEKISYPSEVNYAYTSDIWVDPNDADHLISTLSNYYSKSILETYDAGDSWTDHGGNLEENEDGSGNGPSVRAYARLNMDDGGAVHFVGTSAGLYSTRKLDGANTVWVREGENTIGMAVVSQIHARQSDGRIVVSTHGNGVFKTNYATSIDEFDAKTLGFVVSEVYPNPASEQINFVLNTDNNAFVEVKLLDIQGIAVANILSEEFTGTKRVSYNASNLTAGTYFLHISDGTHFVTKKVSIIR